VGEFEMNPTAPVPVSQFTFEPILKELISEVKELRMEIVKFRNSMPDFRFYGYGNLCVKEEK
jgi:hypothetical protein